MRAELRTATIWLGLLMVSFGIHAEGGFCPPGTIDHNNGRAAAIVCSPIPGYGQQQAPQRATEQWESRWGAIATSTQDGILGAAAGKRSEREASQLAIQNCQSKGGAKCKVDVSYDNQCAAVVVGDGGYNVQNASTLEKAVATGTKICREGGLANCHVYYTACSLPVQLR